MPLDYNGRSHHYVQAQAFTGGGYVGTNDNQKDAGYFTFGAQADYIYYAEDKLIVRAGVPLTGRFPSDASGEENFAALGVHLALLPVVAGGSGGPMVGLLCLGPDVRVEKLFAPGEARFSLPVVLEGVVFAAGD